MKAVAGIQEVKADAVNVCVDANYFIYILYTMLYLSMELHWGPREDSGQWLKTVAGMGHRMKM